MPIPSFKTDSVNIVIKFFDNFIYDILITYTLFLTHPLPLEYLTVFLFSFYRDHISEGRPRTIFFILLIMLSLTLLIPLVKYFYSHCNPFLSLSCKLDKCILFFHNLSWWHLYIHIHYKFDYLDNR